MTNRPTRSEQNHFRHQYEPAKGKILKWVVMHCGQRIFEHHSPAICENYIKVNQLRNAFKKPIYESR